MSHPQRAALLFAILAAGLSGCEASGGGRTGASLMPAEATAAHRIAENPVVDVADDPWSTFSIDVDTASYTNARRYLLQENVRPPAASVRIEEWINFFDYDYPAPTGNAPIRVTTEAAPCPWNEEHALVLVGLRGKDVAVREQASNLVFLIDVSGSMHDQLDLVKGSMTRLLGRLGAEDRVSIVTYAATADLVLSPTPCDQRESIERAIEGLTAGGSTNGGAGLDLAYDCAAEGFRKGGVNRVILATDGDFNVGVRGRGDLATYIAEKRDSGVYLTVCGVGNANFQDAAMEALADAGNGRFLYLDTSLEGRKAFDDEVTGNLVVVAKDVKVQVEFNPETVKSYRLLGYENRVLEDHEFDDAKRDAGELGAGHTVTALFEITPTGTVHTAASPPEARYAANAALAAQRPTSSAELAFVRLHWKDPATDAPGSLNHPVAGIQSASANLRHASAVAAMGMILRGSQHLGSADFAMVERLARSALEGDANGHRHEFLRLAQLAADLE